MTRLWAVLGLALIPGLAMAQERIPPEKAQKYAELFVKQAAKLRQLPLPVEPDGGKAYGVHREDMGALVLPEKGLSAEGLQGKGVAPLGQLWFHKLTPLQDGQPVPNGKLRIVTMTHEDEAHALSLYLLGVRKKMDGALELVVYAGDKGPLLTLPLQKAEVKQELPIELEGQAGADKGVLTLNVLGKYQAKLEVTRQEE